MFRPCVRWFVAVAVLSCGTPPPPREVPAADAATGSRRARAGDDCAPENGEPAEPLLRRYEGVAARARCQREVYTIMGGVTHALGVKCDYCHAGDDYPRMTHRKQIANWMARELIPSLEERAGGEVWCNDCHRARGKGSAKILGNPRDQKWAVEWMTTHLVERFASAEGAPLRCKHCHVGNFGSSDFERRLILEHELPPANAP